MRRVLSALMTFACSVAASAQPGVTSAVRTVTMSATKQTSLSVNVISGATQSLATFADNAITQFPTPVRITAAWAVGPSTNSVRLVAYFTNAAQALANGTNYLVSSRVQGRVLTTPTTTWQPTNWRAFTQNGSAGVGVNGATLRIMLQTINAANRQSSRTMDLDLRLNLVGQPATTAGTYAGTITLRAFTT